MSAGSTLARRLRAILLLAVLAGAESAVAPSGLAAQKPDAPYIPTPMEVLTTMLEVAEPTPDDTVYDLGSGDGRLVIEAAERYGATGVGVEIQARLNERARQRADEAGVADRVRFMTADLFDVSLRPATVLMLYLGRRINRQLRPRILEQMRPGSRVVSHAFDMGQWKPDSLVEMPEELALVFSWVVPVDAAGRWRVTLPGGEEVTLRLDQKFQELRIVEADTREGVELEEPVLRGRRIWFGLVRSGRGEGGETVNMTGTVEGDRMEGALPSGGRWSAVRIGGGGGSLDEWSEEADRTSCAGCSPPGGGLPSPTAARPVVRPSKEHHDESAQHLRRPPRIRASRPDLSGPRGSPGGGSGAGGHPLRPVRPGG